MEKIKIVIVDDLEDIRNLYKNYLMKQAEFKFVGEADSGLKAYSLVKEIYPDIVLMDIEMESKYSGLEATKKISTDFPDAKVIILTMHDDDEIFINSYVAGAKAFLLKNSSEEKIFDTIQRVYYGNYMLDADGTQKVLSRLYQFATERQSLLFVMNILSTLTKTETEILKNLYEGKSYNEIISTRFIEKKTLESHITSVLKKFNVKSTKQLISDLKELRVFDNLFI